MKKTKDIRLTNKECQEAIALIEDGVEFVDFTLNYGRGHKSRVLRLWLINAQEFLKKEGNK